MGKARPIIDIPWGWRSMWVIAMFDLPTDTPNARKAYSQFRKTLLEDGFTMMQYSVYIRHCASAESAEVHMKRVEKLIPQKGHVSIIKVTDKQYGDIVNFWGKKSSPLIETPAQLEIF